jgi:hypothetical protein
MLELMLTILFISAFINGLFISMDEGMVLNPYLKWLEKKLVKKTCSGVNYHFLYKPLGGCLACMASIFGSIAWWTISPFTIHNLILWPLVVVALVFTNLLLNKLI